MTPFRITYMQYIQGVLKSRLTSLIHQLMILFTADDMLFITRSSCCSFRNIWCSVHFSSCNAVHCSNQYAQFSLCSRYLFVVLFIFLQLTLDTQLVMLAIALLPRSVAILFIMLLARCYLVRYSSRGVAQPVIDISRGSYCHHSFILE